VILLILVIWHFNRDGTTGVLHVMLQKMHNRIGMLLYGQRKII